MSSTVRFFMTFIGAYALFVLGAILIEWLFWAGDPINKGFIMMALKNGLLFSTIIAVSLSFIKGSKVYKKTKSKRKRRRSKSRSRTQTSTSVN